jgi:hypothetical protein
VDERRGPRPGGVADHLSHSAALRERSPQREVGVEVCERGGIAPRRHVAQQLPRWPHNECEKCFLRAATGGVVQSDSTQAVMKASYTRALRVEYNSKHATCQEGLLRAAATGVVQFSARELWGSLMRAAHA